MAKGQGKGNSTTNSSNDFDLFDVATGRDVKHNLHSMNFSQIWFSHIEIYSKKFRVGYRTNFPVIQLHVSSCFHG